LLVTDDILQLSEVVGVPKDTPVAKQEASAQVVMSVGQVISGRTVSYTFTFCLQTLVLPELSVTYHQTVVTPAP
jgi:hypothetical protein